MDYGAQIAVRRSVVLLLFLRTQKVKERKLTEAPAMETEPETVVDPAPSTASPSSPVVIVDGQAAGSASAAAGEGSSGDGVVRDGPPSGGGAAATEDRVKGPWSPEEDAILSRLVSKFGARNWSLIARGIPGRSGKSCRLRWCNQLDPYVKRRPFTGTSSNNLFASSPFNCLYLSMVLF